MSSARIAACDRCHKPLLNEKDIWHAGLQGYVGGSTQRFPGQTFHYHQICYELAKPELKKQLIPYFVARVGAWIEWDDRDPEGETRAADYGPIAMIEAQKEAFKPIGNFFKIILDNWLLIIFVILILSFIVQWLLELLRR